MDAIPVAYRGCELSVVVAHAAGGFVPTLLIEWPGNVRRTAGPFRPCATAKEAVRLAIEYGKAELDGLHMRHAPGVASV